MSSSLVTCPLKMTKPHPLSYQITRSSSIRHKIYQYKGRTSTEDREVVVNLGRTILRRGDVVGI